MWDALVASGSEDEKQVCEVIRETASAMWKGILKDYMQNGSEYEKNIHKASVTEEKKEKNRGMVQQMSWSSFQSGVALGVASLGVARAGVRIGVFAVCGRAVVSMSEHLERHFTELEIPHHTTTKTSPSACDRVVVLSKLENGSTITLAMANERSTRGLSVDMVIVVCLEQREADHFVANFLAPVMSTKGVSAVIFDFAAMCFAIIL